MSPLWEGQAELARKPQGEWATPGRVGGPRESGQREPGGGPGQPCSGAWALSQGQWEN